MANLVFEGPDGPVEIDLPAGSVVLGRERAVDVDIRIPGDVRMSRRHACFTRDAQGWLVADLGSANGTFVNGISISAPHRLRPGDVIRVGTTELAYRETSATVEDGECSHGGSLDLSLREREVIRLVARGFSDKQIARELTISPTTVRSHYDRIHAKTLCRGRPALARLAVALGLVSVHVTGGRR